MVHLFFFHFFSAIGHNSTNACWFRIFVVLLECHIKHANWLYGCFDAPPLLTWLWVVRKGSILPRGQAPKITQSKFPDGEFMENPSRIRNRVDLRFRSQRWILVPSNGGFLQWLCSISCDSPGRRQKTVSWRWFQNPQASFWCSVWVETEFERNVSFILFFGKDGSHWLWNFLNRDFPWLGRSIWNLSNHWKRILMEWPCGLEWHRGGSVWGWITICRKWSRSLV